MNEGLIIFLISFALTFIILLELGNLVKIARIERDVKKSVKQVEVIRHQSQIQSTIIQFEARGWLNKEIKPLISDKPWNKDCVVITFIK